MNIYSSSGSVIHQTELPILKCAFPKKNPSTPIYLKRQPDSERLNERLSTVIYPNNPKRNAQKYDEAVPANCLDPQTPTFKFQMKIARPDKAEHSSCEVSDEAHQDTEMRDRNCKQDRHHN